MAASANGVAADPSPLFRDFDAEIDEALGEPVTFKLGGTVFTCVNPIPIGSMLVMAKNSLTDPDNLQAQAKQAGVLWDFVIPEQHAELDAAISKLSDMFVLQRVLEHIAVAASGRPTPGS